MENYFLYILYSPALDKYYIGSSHDPQIRLQYHNTFPKGWTRRGRPWKLIYAKPFSSKEEALKWEKWLKRQKDRSIVQSIIDGKFHWQY